MRLNELYHNNKIDISIELFPPKTQSGTDLMFEQVHRLNQYRPAYFSMTYGAAGTTRDQTLELIKTLKTTLNVETMCHLTIIGQSKNELARLLDELQETGIYNIIALRGDPPQGTGSFTPHPNGFSHAIDLVRETKKRSFFSIAVAGFPEMHPDSPDASTDIQYLKEKVDAGADIIITQLFFDNQYYFRYLDKVRKAGIQIPVIPGILPIISVAQVRRFTQMCHATIPKEVEEQLQRFENNDEAATAYGIELSTSQCRELIQSGVPGIHFYSLNRSHSAESVLKHLALQG
ncbi:MAG: methylenetetrahydrofolate reductase [NAD(P)H] [Chlamydiota bacterium]|nr:methylenetetrahydrofolate reductase [NAD(P)H] [Chlamydiota bacterium]